jgi:hypothetical protein
MCAVLHLLQLLCASATEFSEEVVLMSSGTVSYRTLCDPFVVLIVIHTCCHRYYTIPKYTASYFYKQLLFQCLQVLAF